HRRLACEPGGCSAPVAGYSACLTSFTSSIRFSLHAYGLTWLPERGQLRRLKLGAANHNIAQFF
ncbi:hypothetical protein, partial [Citrobacter freundii]|uniref:hypothetical protein n=1 Tax=Citrobacter freundii TaxID=546 RepID=UPI00404148EF